MPMLQLRPCGYAELLQSCQAAEEAFPLSTSVLRRLLPGAGGRCYSLRACRNRVVSA